LGWGWGRGVMYLQICWGVAPRSGFPLARSFLGNALTLPCVEILTPFIWSLSEFGLRPWTWIFHTTQTYSSHILHTQDTPVLAAPTFKSEYSWSQSSSFCPHPSQTRKLWGMSEKWGGAQMCSLAPSGIADLFPLGHTFFFFPATGSLARDERCHIDYWAAKCYASYWLYCCLLIWRRFGSSPLFIKSTFHWHSYQLSQISTFALQEQ
jgi:hypothetical protein